MSKEIRFNAFAMNCVGHMAPGLWQTDVDGFNLTYAVMPESYENIIDLLIPELQRRRVYKKEYQSGSLREKLFGQGPYLPETHPGRRVLK
jgi:hypothetical protein